MDLLFKSIDTTDKALIIIFVGCLWIWHIRKKIDPKRINCGVLLYSIMPTLIIAIGLGFLCAIGTEPSENLFLNPKEILRIGFTIVVGIFLFLFWIFLSNNYSEREQKVQRI